MDSKALCDFCNSLDFGVAGFCGSDLGDRLNVEEELALDKIFQNSQCFFCRKIAEFFREWEHRRFDNEVLDLEDARASFLTVPIESLEFNTEGRRKGHLIRFKVAVHVKKPPPSDGYFGPTIEFQKCSQHPLTVENFCKTESLFDWENGQEEAYSGRIRALLADTGLFRKWKESCSNIHGDNCNLTFTGQRLPRLRLIDVQNRCVVDSEDDSSYTALSYVWGGATLPKLTKSTDKKFREKGSLKTTTLPSTIDEATELNSTLNHR